MHRKSTRILAAVGLAAFLLSAGAASADPVADTGQVVRRGAHEVANGGRAVGHVAAATGRHVKHDVNGTSDQYNDHPGHAGYWRHHHRHHRHHRAHPMHPMHH
jgi:hypothetical protein